MWSHPVQNTAVTEPGQYVPSYTPARLSGCLCCTTSSCAVVQASRGDSWFSLVFTGAKTRWTAVLHQLISADIKFMLVRNQPQRQ